MKKDTDRLSDNISKILNLSKIEDLKYPLDISKIYLTDFIQGILKKNDHIFKNANVKISGDKDLVIFADHMLFETLIINVLSNAVIYNKNNPILIDIKVIDQNDEFEISFSDNGIGLLKSEKYKIFKKYYRVEKVVKGSGIGLYLAQHIAKLHKGSLSVESPGLGLGSVFYMRFKKENYAI
jgi:signal transduction histidine kinase